MVCCYGEGGIFSLIKLNPSPFPQARGKAVSLSFKFANFCYFMNLITFKIHIFFDPDFFDMFNNITFHNASQKTFK